MLFSKRYAVNAVATQQTKECPMTIDAHYTRWADRYDTDPNATRDLDRAATVEVLGPLTVGMAIEAGCGTGKNTSLLASISQSVLALDFSPGMLARARARVQDHHVQFQQADLLQTWPCGDGLAELVSCNLVLEHIEHMVSIFRESARVLIPGGRFFVSELHPNRQYLGSQARFVDDQGETTRIQAYVHHVSDFTRAALDADFEIERLDEWWGAEDAKTTPRLLTLLVRKPSN